MIQPSDCLEDNFTLTELKTLARLNTLLLGSVEYSEKYNDNNRFSIKTDRALLTLFVSLTHLFRCQGWQQSYVSVIVVIVLSENV